METYKTEDYTIPKKNEKSHNIGNDICKMAG
jgi:hypothetical protein